MAQSNTYTAVKPWLEHFDPSRRSLVANLFHNAVRAGASHPDAVLRAVAREVQRRLAWGSDPAQHPTLADALALLQSASADALAYAQGVLAWEGLPRAERDRQKRARAGEYQRQYMSTQAPTEKQLLYLKRLGDDGPAPTDRLAASEMIDHLLQRKKHP